MPRVRGRSTSDHIAGVAGQLFYREGIQSLAVDRIADIAGVTKKTLYKHFASKELLLAAAVRGESPLAIRDRPGDARERIAEVFQQLADFVSDPEFHGCPVLSAVALLADPRHPARAAIHDIRVRRRLWFRDRLLELGVTDAETAADQLIVTYDGGLAAATILRSSAPGRAAAQTAAMIVRDALAAVRRSPSHDAGRLTG